MTSDRDRLIELLDIIIQPGEKTLGDIADYLLANGVTVLPIPIGTVVYEIRAKGTRRYNGRKFDYAISSKLMFRNAIYSGEELYVKAKVCTKTDIVRMNKTVFLNEIDAHKEIERWVRINEMPNAYRKEYT